MRQANQETIRKEQKEVPKVHVLYQLLKINQGECVQLQDKKMQMVSVSQISGKSPEGREYIELTGIFYRVKK
jgi:hypothetical protein